MTAWRVFAVVGWGLAVFGAVGAVVVRVVSQAPFLPDDVGFGPMAMVAILTMGLSWASIGALLVIRRPENAIGRIMVVFGAAYALSMLSGNMTLAFAADRTAGGLRLAGIAAWVTVLFTTIGALEFLIGLLFPTGRVQGPRWVWVLRLYWLVMVVFAAIVLFQPGPLHLFPSLQNPFGVGPDLRGDQPIAPVFGVVAAIVVPLFAFSLITRYRDANHTERQQLKWLFLALAVSGIGLAFAWYGAILVDRQPDGLGLTVYAFAAAGVPVAIAIAILRHHLYDIDRIVSRTIAYAVVTAILAGVFGAVIVLLSTALSSFAQGQTIAVAGSTLAAFAVFQPVLRRVRRDVDRRFDRSRYDAEQTVAMFSDRLRDQIDLADLSRDLDAAIHAAIAPRSVGIWLREGRR